MYIKETMCSLNGNDEHVNFLLSTFVVVQIINVWF